MKSIEIPPLYSLDGWNSTVDAVFNWAKKDPNLHIIERLVDDKWQPITAKEFAQQVESVARGFIALGLKPGDRVVLISATRYEWSLFDFAIWAAGGVTVSVYESSAAEQIKWIIEDSEAVGVIIENDIHAQRIAELGTELFDVQWVHQIDTDNPATAAISAIAELGKNIPAEQVHERIKNTTINDTATLIYTSGTTGKPKGVVLTHKNFIAEGLGIASTSFRELFVPGRKTLFFLPLAHVFARGVSVSCFIAGVTVGHFGDTNRVGAQFPAFKPDFIVSVPRVFEKIYAAAHQKAIASGKGKIFDKAASVAVAYAQGLAKGKVPFSLKIRHAIFDKLVYSKLKEAMGGKCAYAISGGAPLGDYLGYFFQGVGVPVYEGYGLTETTAALCVNTIGFHKVGTVGMPMNGQGVKIADDGEILLQGDVVFKEYWKNPQATSDSNVDGWFASGDLGVLDEDGYLSIVGRKKDILVTAGGKNVAPAPLEDIIRRNELVSQAMVIGDNQPFVAAFITLDSDAFEAWKVRTNKPAAATIAELADDADLLGVIQTSIDEANKTVSRAESIRKIKILPNDFTVDSGELTQSLKVKRSVVLEKHKDDFDWVYSTGKR